MDKNLGSELRLVYSGAFGAMGDGEFGLLFRKTVHRSVPVSKSFSMSTDMWTEPSGLQLFSNPRRALGPSSEMFKVVTDRATGHR